MKINLKEGERYGSFTVVSEESIRRKNWALVRMANVKCTCGIEKKASVYRVVNLKIKCTCNNTSK